MLVMCTRSKPGNLTVVFLFIISILNTFADANSWLKPTSGNWEEPQWSQGILPNSGHAVMITNAGWKAVQIAASTAQNFPNSLNVYSVTVLSPVDSFNTLFLNYAGFNRPLTVNYSMHIGPGAALTMSSSAFNIATPGGVGLSVGGEVNQNDFSQVTGNQVDVGYVGPGVYNFNSGLVQLQHLWLGGTNGGIFNQNGGSNSPGILHMESGTYNLRDGDFNGTTYTSGGTVFRQDGGRVHSLLEFHGGQYILNNGINYGGVSVPVYGNYRNGNASAIQNGGTILGPIRVGALSGGGTGSGSYTLSNGVISAPVIALSMFGEFHQYGGTVTTPGAITLSFGYYNRSLAAGSSYLLDGGSVSSAGMHLDISSFAQRGGTNQIAGSLGLSGSWYGSTTYGLSGGLLVTENTTLGDATSGGFFQSGGTHRVANRLSISGAFYNSAWKGYEMSGGNLIVSNIALSSRGTFRQSGGTVAQSGTLTVDSGAIFTGPGNQQFGALQLAGTGTNELTMPSAASVLRFQNSSAIPWDSTASLIINNWSGSHLGGGSQRIIFGNSAAALTPQQVAKISFRNPAGLAYGMHPAKILSTGEIVPDSFPPVGRTPPRLALRKLPDSTVEITLAVEPGYDYGVLTSTDLATWNFWTNRVATNNTITVVDPNQVHWWPYRRFYKAVFMR